MDGVKHDVLQQLVGAGVVRGVDVIGQPGGWILSFTVGVSQKTLVNKLAQARVFSSIETVVSYLDKLKIRKFVVDATLFDNNVKRFSRPDRKNK